MKPLLFLLLLFFIYWGARLAIGAWRIFRQINNVRRQFDDINRQWSGQTGSASRGSARQPNSSAREEQPTRRTSTQSGDIIEDRRTEDEINRKIFAQDEGEYVDFEEVE